MRHLGDALALATTPKEEVVNPADAIAMPSPMSLAARALPSPVSVQESLDTFPRTSQNPEVLVTFATRSFGGSEEPPAMVPTGLRVLVVDDDALTRT
jgi:hypothetical protein